MTFSNLCATMKAGEAVNTTNPCSFHHCSKKGEVENMKKFLTSMILMALMTMALACTASAAEAPDDFLLRPETTESTLIRHDIRPDAPVGADEDPAIGEQRNWLAEQVRFETVSDGYHNGAFHASIKLADVTKIVFIANRVCPTYYDSDGSLWVSNINIPCGISMRYYRFLDLASRLAAEYGEEGADALARLYSADELSAIYTELKDLAPADYDDLIAQLDGFMKKHEITKKLKK